MTFLHRARGRIAAALAAGALLLAAAPVSAIGLSSNYVFTTDVPVTITGNGVVVVIRSGSKADSFTVDASTITVSVAAGDTFTLRYPGPNPGQLSNNGGLGACQPSAGNNDVAVVGPASAVIFTPVATPICSSGGGGGGGGGGSAQTTILPSVHLAAPNGGETLDAEEQYQVFWTAGGTGVQYVRLKLSTDGGATWPTTIADNLPNTGFYTWTVAHGLASTQALVRIESIGQGGGVLVSDDSDATFTIRDLTVITPSPTIEADKNIPPPPPAVNPACVAGTRIKLPSDNDSRTQADSAVYYCGKDGKRYVFPDQYVYFSWYPDFSGITIVSADVMSKIPIGGNVTFKPGALVKITTDPKVYVVSKGGRLRWVTTEAIAVALFGDKWWQQVHDVPDSFFFNYVIGDPITSVP